MEEIWKDIPGYEGLYQASSLGNVRSRKKLLTKSLSYGNGSYVSHKVSLIKEGKVTGFSVRTLIAATFLENPRNYRVVKHINGNFLDDRAENLMYAEKSRVGLTGIHKNSRKVFQYDKSGNLAGVYASQTEAAKATGIQVQNIHHCIKGTAKSAGGYVFRESSTADELEPSP